MKKSKYFIIAFVFIICIILSYIQNSNANSINKQYWVQKIDGCEYIIIMSYSGGQQSGVSIIHKANCKNHRELY